MGNIHSLLGFMCNLRKRISRMSKGFSIPRREL